MKRRGAEVQQKKRGRGGGGEGMYDERGWEKEWL